jgi:hypothetical protein
MDETRYLALNPMSQTPERLDGYSPVVPMLYGHTQDWISTPEQWEAAKKQPWFDQCEGWFRAGETTVTPFSDTPIHQQPRRPSRAKSGRYRTRTIAERRAKYARVFRHFERVKGMR